MKHRNSKSDEQLAAILALTSDWDENYLSTEIIEDDIKNKASEVIYDVKLKAKEAKLGAEKVADDLKHKAKETLLKGEQKVNDLKHKKDDESDKS